MQLVGISEKRYFGHGTFVTAIFIKEDGEEFELQISLDQAATILSQSGELEEKKKPSAPAKKQVAVPQPAKSDEFEDDEGTIRLAAFNARRGGDDDEDSL